MKVFRLIHGKEIKCQLLNIRFMSINIYEVNIPFLKSPRLPNCKLFVSHTQTKMTMHWYIKYPIKYILTNINLKNLTETKQVKMLN